MRVDTLAHRKNFASTTKRLASEVGFCLNDKLADPIAESLAHKVVVLASDCESRVNRLYRGRETFTLSASDRRALAKAAERFAYMQSTLLAVLEAQEPSQFVEAAE